MQPDVIPGVEEVEFRPYVRNISFVQVFAPLKLHSQSAPKSELLQARRKSRTNMRRSRVRLVHLSAKPPSPPGNPEELRAQLLDLVSEFGRSGGVNASAVRDVEAAVRALISSRGGGETPPLIANDLDPTETGSWAKRLEGRWDLRFSTEGPLLRLMTAGAYPILSTGDVYQVFRGDGTLQNVVEFDRDVEKKTLAAVLSVGVDYETSDVERRCDFRFRRTRVQLGRSARASIYEAKGVRDGLSLTGGLNLDLEVPFALGEGYFRVVWLDHVLRIDRDTSNGKDWLNIYVYAGPPDKCTA